jgi:hypothetical protein
VPTGVGGDRRAGLARPAAEEPVEDRAGLGPGCAAVEPREGALQEGGHAVRAAFDGLRGEGGVGQEGLGVGVIPAAPGEPSGPVVRAPG